MPCGGYGTGAVRRCCVRCGRARTSLGSGDQLALDRHDGGRQLARGGRLLAERREREARRARHLRLPEVAAAQQRRDGAGVGELRPVAARAAQLAHAEARLLARDGAAARRHHDERLRRVRPAHAALVVDRLRRRLVPADLRERRRRLVLRRVQLVARERHEPAQRARLHQRLLRLGVVRQRERGQRCRHRHHGLHLCSAQQPDQQRHALLGHKLELEGWEPAACGERTAGGDLRVRPRVGEQLDQLTRRVLLEQHILVQQQRRGRLQLGGRGDQAVRVGEVGEVAQSLERISRVRFGRAHSGAAASAGGCCFLPNFDSRGVEAAEPRRRPDRTRTATYLFR